MTPAIASALDRHWGYAEADSNLVGILVVAIGVLAVSHVILRIRRGRANAANLDKNARSGG